MPLESVCCVVIVREGRGVLCYGEGRTRFCTETNEKSILKTYYGTDAHTYSMEVFFYVMA